MEESLDVFDLANNLEKTRTGAEKLIVVNLFFRFFEHFGPNILVLLRFLQALDGLERSGRLVGKRSSHFRPDPISRYRVMTKKPKKLTTKKATTINM